MSQANIVKLLQAGNSVWMPMDTYRNPFNIGFGVAVTGTVNYTVQHTFDDVQNSAITPTAYNHFNVFNQTANADGNYMAPVTAIRLVQNSGSGTCTLTAIQSGIDR